ncbi:hypothetical protein [Altericista sp. CCNU0014]|uniref:hypothetical protein n=1 Tax=Altericista sp. CCNU0014 TaxID=3082949 RepID=UPI0038502806
MKISEILVMTGTIRVGNTYSVAIKDPDERLFQYLCSLVSWIKFTSIEKIVFCENNNTSYDFKKLIRFAESEGKNLEILIFNGNDGARKYGKGFGEGTIMEYIVKNSRYFSQSKSFYKITGRLFVENFEEIRNKHAQFDNVFKTPGFLLQGYKRWWDPRNIKYKCNMYLFSLRFRGFKNPNYINNNVATYFYKSNTVFFKENLLYSYKKVNERAPYWLEHAYYDDLAKNNFQNMLDEPNIVGKSGSNGSLVNNLDYNDTIKNIAAKFLNT